MEYIKNPEKMYKVEYAAWRNMKQRCLNPKVPNYKHYGGRGIKVCDAWLLFPNFLTDMGLRPSRKHSIERRDNNGNYEPANCYWATHAEQDNNKRDNVFLEYDGLRLTLAQWAERAGMTYDQIRARHRYGWDAKDIIETPKNAHHKPRQYDSNSILLTYRGETLNVTDWATRLGIDREALRARVRYGWDTERILTIPVTKRKR